MHTYTVQFSIVSEKGDLDLEAVTKHLGIIPTNTRVKGERKSERRVHEETMWGYDISSEGTPKTWDSLEDGLDAVLNVFLPVKHKIDEYRGRYDLILWCGHFTSSFDGGPSLSPAILKRLGEFGVELFIDTYCSCEEIYNDDGSLR